MYPTSTHTVHTLTILNQTFDFGGHGTHPWNPWQVARIASSTLPRNEKSHLQVVGCGWFPEKSEKGVIFGGPQNHPSHCLLMGKAMALGSPYFRKAPLPRERLSPATQQRQL